MQELHAYVLKTIAKQEISHRPNRIEPRVIKLRKEQYKLMTLPRKHIPLILLRKIIIIVVLCSKLLFIVYFQDSSKAKMYKLYSVNIR